MMQRAPLLIAGLVCLALTGAAVAQHLPRRGKTEPQARAQYFVDFRARTGGVFGHTFIVYGRTDAHGRALELHYAGLYPHDAFHTSPLLPILVVPGYVTAKKEDDGRQPVTAIYRRRLSAAQFAHLAATVRRLSAHDPPWHLTLYNCNDFVARLAHAVGLRTPPGLQLPNDFVRGIAMMNAR